MKTIKLIFLYLVAHLYNSQKADDNIITSNFIDCKTLVLPETCTLIYKVPSPYTMNENLSVISNLDTSSKNPFLKPGQLAVTVRNLSSLNSFSLLRIDPFSKVAMIPEEPNSLELINISLSYSKR